MRTVAEIAGINKSNALLYLILCEGPFVNIFMMRVYEPVNFEIHNISYKWLVLWSAVFLYKTMGTYFPRQISYLIL